MHDLYPKRKSMRLPHYDYTKSGAYFVTICTKKPFPIFGGISNEKIRLNANGKIVKRSWLSIPLKFKLIQIDQFVILPNHFHGILFIMQDESDANRDDKTIVDLGRIVSYFKYVSTKNINQLTGRKGRKIWQRNYYEHVIRNETDLSRIREYIENNPAKWKYDKYNPDRVSQ